MFKIDPAHAKVDVFSSPLIHDVWNDKYRWKGETHEEMCRRVANAVYTFDGNGAECDSAANAMQQLLWVPGGRILAGAGTEKRVTLMNCYVNETVDDSMEGIMHALRNTALTLQQGGGIGTDFSTLRPEGALLTRTHTKASGPLPFMHMWDRASATIRSAGDRRGAMMGTMCDTHPDLPKFIHSKRTAGALTQFNISVLISDAFMEAVKDDEDWVLHFPAVPVERAPGMEDYDFEDPSSGVKQYAYSIWKARDLWKLITENTYEYSEPGVIFIDRVNELNNLYYCETLRCTNPCVTGDTLILTSIGYVPIKELVGKEVSIWNGFEWSEVTPFETGVNQTYTITFNNGAIVKATGYHEWVMFNGERIKTLDLKSGQEFQVHEFPTIEEGMEYKIDAYSQGFYCGDGTKNSDSSNLYKHSEAIRNRLVGKFWDRNCKSQPGYRWLHGEMLPKNFVPMYGSASYCVNWLAGLLDADGNIARPNKDAMPVLQITAKDREFLEHIRLMLTRLGVNARFWERKDSGAKLGTNGKTYMCESTACLMISGKGAFHLQQLGLKTERVDMSWVREPKGVSRKGVKVVSVQPAAIEATYCFTEPKRHSGVFNGVLGGNCGEQPLPPHGTCNLGHVNLARVVRHPFTAQAELDFDLIRSITRVGVRFLDNVIDITNYPLAEQEQEEKNKRRLGLGFTGLADCLAQLGIRYGSPEAVRVTEKICYTICWEAYSTSADLAAEKGSFPLYDADKYLKGNNFASINLPTEVKKKIRQHGIRNSLLLTIAPTGTGSIVVGNVSSGCEPVFLHEAKRKVLKSTSGAFSDEHQEYISRGYGAELFRTLHPDEADFPQHMVTAEDLTVEEHIVMQAACQRWIDSSISKTINLPKETPYDQFVKVYDMAYSLGCKGCTTYRPSDVRGSVLSAPGEEHQAPTLSDAIRERPEVLEGKTYKIKWPSIGSAIYLTINHSLEQPFEVFLSSKDAKFHDWATALTVMITAIFRKGGDIRFVAKELQQIQSLNDSAFKEGYHHPSLVAYIGFKLEQHIADMFGEEVLPVEIIEKTFLVAKQPEGDRCPKCMQMTFVREEGCKKCGSCGFSTCG